jgi:hypothetical protein
VCAAASSGAGGGFSSTWGMVFEGAKLLKNTVSVKKCRRAYRLKTNELVFLSKKISTYSFLLKKSVFLPPISVLNQGEGS